MSKSQVSTTPRVIIRAAGATIPCYFLLWAATTHESYFTSPSDLTGTLLYFAAIGGTPLMSHILFTRYRATSVRPVIAEAFFVWLGALGVIWSVIFIFNNELVITEKYYLVAAALRVFVCGFYAGTLVLILRSSAKR